MIYQSGPATSVVEVTASDVTVLTACRALYVGTGGDVTVRTVSGQTVTFHNVPDGAILPVSVDQVRAASTASQIRALY